MGQKCRVLRWLEQEEFLFYQISKLKTVLGSVHSKMLVQLFPSFPEIAAIQVVSYKFPLTNHRMQKKKVEGGSSKYKS